MRTCGARDGLSQAGGVCGWAWVLSMANQRENIERATEVRTVVMPDYEVPVTETPGLNPEDRLATAMAEGYSDMVAGRNARPRADSSA